MGQLSVQTSRGARCETGYSPKDNTSTMILKSRVDYHTSYVSSYVANNIEASRDTSHLRVLNSSAQTGKNTITISNEGLSMNGKEIVYKDREIKNMFGEKSFERIKDKRDEAENRLTLAYDGRTNTAGHLQEVVSSHVSNSEVSISVKDRTTGKITTMSVSADGVKGHFGTLAETSRCTALLIGAYNVGKSESLKLSVKDTVSSMKFALNSGFVGAMIYTFIDKNIFARYTNAFQENMSDFNHLAHTLKEAGYKENINIYDMASIQKALDTFKSFSENREMLIQCGLTHADSLNCHDMDVFTKAINQILQNNTDGAPTKIDYKSRENVLDCLNYVKSLGASGEDLHIGKYKEQIISNAIAGGPCVYKNNISDISKIGNDMKAAATLYQKSSGYLNLSPVEMAKIVFVDKTYGTKKSKTDDDDEPLSRKLQKML